MRRIKKGLGFNMKITVIGCGRWGSLITWYLDRVGHDVTLYGREDDPAMIRFLNERCNDVVTLPESVKLTTDINRVPDCDAVLISINSQGLRSLLKELEPLEIKNKIFILCMKGIEISTGMRLSQVTAEGIDPSNNVAVWIGPGHPQEFYAGVPNCMVIDSADKATKKLLVEEFSSDLIRFYYGEDLIGNARPETPTMLDYKAMAENNSMYNTPPCWCIYMAKLVFDWILSIGGLEEMKRRNERKASLIYDYLDSQSYYTAPVDKKCRSMMNVVFVTGDAELDKKFAKEAAEAGLKNLKGHRSVGGMRASIYNAMPYEGVEALVAFMKKFAAENPKQ